MAYIYRIEQENCEPKFFHMFYNAYRYCNYRLQECKDTSNLQYSDFMQCKEMIDATGEAKPWLNKTDVSQFIKIVRISMEDGGEMMGNMKHPIQ
jgi:hypothetical protein